MKATDLMLNDLVLFGGKVAKVIGIDTDGKVSVLFDGHLIARFVCEEKLLPIPITPRILEENGWNYDDIDHEWYGFGLNLGGYNPEEYTILDGRRISFVHKLQHFLRDCKINKEIIL